MLVNPQGSATGILLLTEGIQEILRSAGAADTIINGGQQSVLSGGSATDTTLNLRWGSILINNGGSATDTRSTPVRLNTSTMVAALQNTTINSGGGQYVYINEMSQKRPSQTAVYYRWMPGGSASQVTQNSGGAIVTNTGAVLSGTNDKGTFSIAGGSASAICRWSKW